MEHYRQQHSKRTALAGLVITLSVLAAALTSQSYAGASWPQDQDMNFTLEGKISKLEGAKFVVSTEQNIIFHVRYTDKTTFSREDGAAASAKDLHVGIRVKVEGDLTESGEIVAKTIHFQAGGGAKPPA